jgi:hypothetical protein
MRPYRRNPGRSEKMIVFTMPYGPAAAAEGIYQLENSRSKS